MSETDPDWAPSLHLGYGKQPNSGQSAARYKRRLSRAMRTSNPLVGIQMATCDTDDAAELRMPNLDEDVAVEQSIRHEEPPMETCALAETAEFSQNTELTMADIALMEEANKYLLAKLVDAKATLSTHLLTEDGLRKEEDKVQFYTGLPSFTILISLFEVLKGSVSHNSRNSLTQFQEMLIFLMRLRLNLPLQDLAYSFLVSQSTVSRIVNKWLDAAFVRLSLAVKWPDRHCLRSTMPMAFRKSFGTQVAVIIDCFEVFIERPTSMLPRSQTWSTYKHHNTMKFLIGIAPQGVITFISRGWCGRTSDKVIAEECGVLDNLLPGDIVLADRGFTVRDAVGLHCAKLEIPAFTKGKPQLSAQEVEKTRKLANVRIHVERVIGLVRNKYSIPKYTLPVEFLAAENENCPAVLDKVAFVCAALCNLNASTVPFG